jgi:hypothetical protein
MSTRAKAGAVVSYLVLTTTTAGAEPSTTAWLEDVNVQPARTAETLLGYEHQLTDIKARGAGFDELRFGLHAGLAEAVSVVPRFAMLQRGAEPLRLRDVGFQMRWRALDWQAWPQLMVYGAYLNDLDDERDHLLNVGLAARYELGSVLFNADVRPTLAMGGHEQRTLEGWFGLGVGYVWRGSWTARAGAEAFAIVPFEGERLSDPTFGASAESTTLYYGPSLSVATGPFWTSASMATGYFVSTPASQFMLSWLVGVAH